MIYTGSRYTKTNVFEEDGVRLFEMRDLAEFTLNGCKNHVWTQGDTIDGVSHKYYGTSQYWWVIMDANVKYMFPTEIQTGDILKIPHISEVLTKV